MEKMKRKEKKEAVRVFPNCGVTGVLRSLFASPSIPVDRQYSLCESTMIVPSGSKSIQRDITFALFESA